MLVLNIEYRCQHQLCFEILVSSLPPEGSAVFVVLDYGSRVELEGRLKGLAESFGVLEVVCVIYCCHIFKIKYS